MGKVIDTENNWLQPYNFVSEVTSLFQVLFLCIEYFAAKSPYLFVIHNTCVHSEHPVAEISVTFS